MNTKPIIIGPENPEASIFIYSEKETTSFIGFSFEQIADPSKIIVSNTFSQGLASFQTSVVNINLINKTFDVKIVAYNSVATTTPLSGKLSFYYENQLIEDAPQNTFLLNILKKPIITDTIQTTQTVLLDNNGAGQCVFSGFKVQNAPEDLFTNLEYDVSFTQAGTKITTSLQQDGDSEFSLCVSITSGIAGTIQSNISFTYKKRLIPMAWDDKLTIQLLPPKSVKAPEQDQFTIETTSLTSQLIIPYFTFTSFKQDELDVNVTTTSDVQITGSIVNWDENNNSFDVQINATFTVFCDFDFTLFIVSKDSKNLDPYVEKEFTISTLSIIPREAFNITFDHTPGSSVVCLENLVEEWKTKIEQLKYNTLFIPEDITKIQNNAFNQVMEAATTMDNVKNLFFSPLSCLETIGEHAFRYCSFTNDLVIPYSINSIGTSAFFECKFASLTFANLSKRIDIGENAFMDCGNLRGDIRLPNSVRLHSGSFWNTGFDGTIYFPPDLGNTGEDLGSGFMFIKNIKALDLSIYTDIPPWLATGKCNLEDIGNEEQGGVVYYNSILTDTKVNQLKEKMSQNGLGNFFQFLPK